MGARWAWHARCEDGHWTGGFSGGSDGECCATISEEGKPYFYCGKALIEEFRCIAWDEQSDKSCEEAGCFKESPSAEEIEKAEINRITAILLKHFGHNWVYAPAIEIAAVIVQT